MFMKFGGNAVCMDSTHGTNIYDFHLVTILVLDDFGEGVPVAWLVSNREDAAVLRQFLLEVKERCGDIKTKVFMSDDADNFYNAWKTVFTVSETKKLICSWHIDKNWRNGLHTHIDVKSKQAEVYHHLRVLIGETVESSFRERLQQFLSWLTDDEDLLAFLEYFQSTYVKRQKQWAPCYRTSSMVNTNMALESFHRVLKVCYMEKKQNRRIDHFLHILLKISRDKVFERLQKTQRGKFSHRICQINKRHVAAKKMDKSESIILRSDQTWKIKPESCVQQCQYTVVKNSADSSCACKVRCNSCDICVHSYSCTCMDYAIHATICKHIHLVHISSDERPPSSSTQEAVPPLEGSFENVPVPPSQLPTPSQSPLSLAPSHPQAADVVDVSSPEYLTHHISHNQPLNDLLHVREQAIATCKKIELSLLNCTSIEAIKAGTKHLRAGLTVLSSIENQECSIMPKKRKIAANANCQPQLRFSSTKKKRKTRPRLAKPNNHEMSKCLETLDEVEIQICGHCFQGDDKCSHATSPSTTVQWIQCQLCDTWFHQSCVIADSEKENIDDNDFICVFCNED